MYAPVGFAGAAELGDVEPVPQGDVLHLFHLCLPSHDRVAHLVTLDGIHWERRPTALTTGSPGEVDDDMIWTMGVVEQAGVHHMLYTALSSADAGRVQRVARATSSDLDRWEKHGLAFEADPRWYEVDLERGRWVAWRDPKPVRMGDRWYATVCARGLEGPALHRGVVGLASSEDLCRWTVEPPLLEPRTWLELECPQVFTIGERSYLIASVMEDRSQRYWMSDSIRGPWYRPAVDRLAPPGHYAGRITRWKDRDLFLCWHEPAGAGPAGRVIPSPLVLEPEADGSLGLSPWPFWDLYHDGPARPLGVPAPDPRRGNPAARASADPGRVDLMCHEGAETWALGRLELPGGLLLRGSIHIGGARGAVGLGLDPDGGGLFFELLPGEGRVALVEHRRDPAAAGGAPWYAYRVMQESRWCPPAGPIPVPIQVLVAHGELQLALGGRVLLHTAIDPGTTAGAFGLGVTGGRIRAEDLTATTLRPGTAGGR